MEFAVSTSNLTEARVVLAAGLIGIVFYIFNNSKPWLFYLAVLWGVFRLMGNWEKWIQQGA